ncbi:MAG: hypothetical protein E6Q97_06570 [Desulfurellales bacterium]|nr:MAG: hypothetical protein E6Q97_06570 [Desulfurellales bacterium]
MSMEVIEFSETRFIGPNDSMLGDGFNQTKYVWKGNPNKPAIVIGPESTKEFLYFSDVGNFRLQGGFIQFHKLGQHCMFHNILIEGTEFGIVIEEAIGERQLFDKILVWNCGQGVKVEATRPLNGLHFRDCNFQNNSDAGIVLETMGSNVDIVDTIFERCTIQANSVGVGLKGWVNGTRFRDTWIEEPKGLKTGIVSRVSRFMDGMARRPNNTVFEGSTTISQCEFAYSGYDDGLIDIDSLVLTGQLNQFRSTQQPTGRMLRVNKKKLLNANGSQWFA